MSKVIEFDRRHFGRDGVVSLTRGDDWSLETKIIEEVGGYRKEVNLMDSSIVGATGYFQADGANENLASSGVSVIKSLIAIGTCPEFEVNLLKAATELVQKAESGTDIYIELEDSLGRIETVYTYSQPVAVRDQGFTVF